MMTEQTNRVIKKWIKIFLKQSTGFFDKLAEAQNIVDSRNAEFMISLTAGVAQGC